MDTRSPPGVAGGRDGSYSRRASVGRMERAPLRSTKKAWW
jgi:hypothetical protein